MKLREKVLEARLCTITTITKNQFGFMSKRSTTEAIHLLRRLMKKYIERNKDLHMTFIDLKRHMIVLPERLFSGLWKLEGSIGEMSRLYGICIVGP